MNKPKILHIEDEIMFGESVAEKLGDRYAVTLAHDSIAATSTLKEYRFDLVLLDIMLANNFNTLSLMESLVASGALVVVLSNRATDGDKRALSRLGARAFVSKYYTVEKLREVIAAVLAGHNHFPPDFMALMSAKSGNELPYLTASQTRLLTMLIQHQDLNLKEVASLMGLSYRYAETLMADLKYRFEVRSRFALMTEAARRGFMVQQTLPLPDSVQA